LKNRGIFLFLPLSFSLNIDGREREMERMSLSGLECKACLVHFKGIKGEIDLI